MAYPGGSDLGFEDRLGSQMSLIWTHDGAEIAVNDGSYDGCWSAVNLGREELLMLAAHIIFGLSETGETVNRVIDALEPTPPGPSIPGLEVA